MNFGVTKITREKQGVHFTETYEFGPPSHQNAIDLIPGWNHAFPEHFHLAAGKGAFYEDTRIHWVIEQFGPLTGKRVLELGPLEGSHTFMLERAGAERVDAIEANKLAYLKCLITKEVYELRNSFFKLGDFVQGLDSPDSYDLVVACGVLYHMANPAALLERMATRANAIYIWTHYFDDVEMPADDPRRGAFKSVEPPHVESIRLERINGLEIKLHLRSYHGAWKESKYCGGPKDGHYWMEKVDIIKILQSLQFSNIVLAHEEPNHPNGPAISILARKS